MTRGMPTFYKILVGAAVVTLAGIAALTVALKTWLPPQKVRQLVVEQAELALHREVRLKSVDLGVIKGLELEGLEVSEKPDFSAGVFAGVENFRLRIRLLPLLRKRVVIDEVTVAGLSLSVVQLKPGVFNFSDLFSAGKGPPSPQGGRSPLPEETGLSLPFALQAAIVELKDGRLAYQDLVSGAQWRLSKLQGVIKDLSLAQPFGVTARMQAEQVAPGSLKARLGFAGQVDLSEMASGRLSLDISKLSADLSGLALSLAGPVHFDGNNIKAEDLQGRLGRGTLAVKAVIRDFNKAPDAQLEASLSELDVAKLLEVKDAAAGPQTPASAADKGPRSPKAQAVLHSPEGAPPPLRTSGKIAVDRILYRTFKADKLLMSWDLKGITPDLRGLSGWAKLSVGGGTFAPEEGPVGASKLMQTLLIPLAVLRQVGRLGAALHLLPSFDTLAFSEIKGDYVCARGLVSIRAFHMDSAAAKVSAAGTIDLPAQKLDHQVTITLANAAPIGVDVGGTFAAPKPRLRLDKNLAAPIRKLAQPALEVLKGLFRSQ